MYCERNRFKRALFDLCNTTYKGKKLVTYENGYYVSHFHTSSNGDSTYLKYLPVLTSEKFLNLTKNQTRLFFYIATLNVHNQFTKVAIENLYKNKLHDLRYGMHVYDDYQSVAEDLFFLIELDLISIRIPGEKSALNKSVKGYKELFHQKCGFINNRKRRTSKFHKIKHVIGLKVNNELFNEKPIANKASETEIRLLAEYYHMFHEDMKKETFNFFIGKKKILMEQFDSAGLEIYRSSLEKYFKEKNENILYYDILGKAENHFKDFYLLEEVKKVILGSIRSALGNAGAISATGYPFTKAHIPSLVEFFINYSGDELKVLIDEDIRLIKKARELMSPLNSNEPWNSLQESIDCVYQKHNKLIKEQLKAECLKNGVSDTRELCSQTNVRAMIIDLAKKAILSQQKGLDEETEKIKRIVRFIKKKQLPIQLDFANKTKEEPRTGRPVPFYDWVSE